MNKWQVNSLEITLLHFVNIILLFFLRASMSLKVSVKCYSCIKSSPDCTFKIIKAGPNELNVSWKVLTAPMW